MAIRIKGHTPKSQLIKLLLSWFEIMLGHVRPIEAIT